METLRIATVASDVVWKSPTDNILAAERHVKQVLALQSDTQIILFPEMSLTGYVLDDSNQTLAEDIEGRNVSEMRRIAKEHHVGLIFGMIEKGEGKFYNTEIALGRDGEVLARYRKNHLFTGSTEPDFYEPGEALAIFEFEGWKCGLSVCFDIRFPRLFESYKKQGVECIFSGFNWVAGRNKPAIMDFLVKARAHENQYFVVAVDRSGADPNTSYHGLSVISNPHGEDIAMRDGLYSYVTLNKSEMEVLRKTLDLNTSFKERYELS